MLSSDDRALLFRHITRDLGRKTGKDGLLADGEVSFLTKCKSKNFQQMRDTPHTIDTHTP